RDQGHRPGQSNRGSHVFFSPFPCGSRTPKDAEGGTKRLRRGSGGRLEPPYKHLGDTVEIAVQGDDSQAVLSRGRGDPEVVRRDRGALPPQVVVDRGVALGGLFI